MRLDGRVAVITGGSRGIGRGIAEAFLAEGASVMISGKSQAKGDQALAEMGAGERAAFLAGDVKVQADVEALIDATVERFGRLDILVANAGIMSRAPFLEMTDELRRSARRPPYQTMPACQCLLEARGRG